MKTLLSLALAFSLVSCAAHRDGGQHAAAPAVDTTTVRVGHFDETVSAVGRVGGVRDGQTALSFLVSGAIARIDVRVGERVSAGEALAALDARGFDLAAGQARSEEVQARDDARADAVDRYSTRVAVDKAALAREESLFRTGLAPKKDVLAAKAQLSEDEADASAASDRTEAGSAALETAELRAQSAERDVRNTVLRSPVDGVVTAISRRAGESVDPSVPVMTVSESAPATVTLDVAASDLPKIHVGDPLQLRIVGSTRSFSGRVLGVANAVDAATQMGTVSAAWNDADAPLGSIIEAKIVVNELPGLIVPKSAIVEDPQTGNAVIFVSERGADGSEHFRQQIVTIGGQDEQTALVRSGLRAGERIASQGGFTLLAPSDSGGD